MALHGQGNRLKMLGGFTSLPSGNFATGAHQANGIGRLVNERQRKFAAGDASVPDRSNHAGIPHGVQPPYCWAMPQVGGAFKSYKRGTVSLEGSADMALGRPFAAAGTAELDGSALMSIVLSLTATGSMSLDGTVVLSNVLAVTASGSFALDGAVSLELLAKFSAAGNMSIDGLINLMQLQSFKASDVVVSGSTQEIIDGVVAGVSGQLGLTAEQENWVRELWRKEGLDATKPVTHTPGSIKIGDPLAPDIEILLTGNRKTLTTMERQ